MLLFAHAGITLGAAALLNRIPSPFHFSPVKEAAAPAVLPEARYWSADSWLTSLGKRLDIRLLIIGSLLPDIIDKPVGMLFLSNTFSSGRIFSHTLLFLILISLAGLYLYFSRNHNWLLVLAFGTFVHFILDELWLSHALLLWPLHGLSFAQIDIATWAPNIFHSLFTDPTTYISELGGLAILIWLGWLLLRRKTLHAFIRHGRVQAQDGLTQT